MRWSVAYRTKDGAQGRTEIDAENRAVVISLLREKAWTVLNIVEAAPRKPAKKPNGVKSSVFWAVVLLAAILSAVVAAALWWLSPREGGFDWRRLRDRARPAGEIRIDFVP